MFVGNKKQYEALDVKLLMLDAVDVVTVSDADAAFDNGQDDINWFEGGQG